MKLSLSTSKTATLKLVCDENPLRVSAVNFVVSGLPLKTVTSLVTDKQVAFNTVNGAVIIYGLNSTVIPTGNIADITFTLPKPYGTYPITLSGMKGASNLAQPVTITKGVDGSIAITFLAADVVATAAQVVGTGVNGIDINADSVIDIIDVQLLANNL